MKNSIPCRVTLALALSTLLHCRERSAAPMTSRTPTPTAAAEITSADDLGLARSAAIALAGTFQRHGAQVTAQDDTVRVDGHALELRAHVRQVVEESDQTTAQVEVSMLLDGQRADAFRTTAVAIDANRHEAIERAVREWNVSMAPAVVDAVLAVYAPSDAGTRGVVVGTAGLTLGPFAVFAGPTGVRGEEPEGLGRGTPEMHRAVLAQIAPGLADIIPLGADAQFHSLRLTLHVHNGRTAGGECGVDGAVHSHLCEQMRAYPWPSGESDFLFKQFYVLVRTR